MAYHTVARQAVPLLLAVALLAPRPLPAESFTHLFSRSFDGVAQLDDEGRDVAAAPDGGAYVAGVTDYAWFVQTSSQWSRTILQRYAPGGSLLWSRTIDPPPGTRGTSQPRVAVGRDGAVYLLGASCTPDFFAECRLSLTKFNPSGGVVWSIAPPGPEYSVVTASYDITVAPDGSLYVSANHGTRGAPRPVLRKLTPSGALVWARAFESAESRGFLAGGLAVGRDGGARMAVSVEPVAGSEDHQLLLLRYAADGKLLLVRRHSARAMPIGLAVSAGGEWYIVGYHSSVAGYEDNTMTVEKYSAGGDFLWERGEGYGTLPNAVAIRRDGSVLALGSVAGEESVEWFVRRWSPAGVLLDSASRPPGPRAAELCLDMTTTSDDALYFACRGSSQPDPAGTSATWTDDLVLVKLR
jgi:hypothetical protein